MVCPSKRLDNAIGTHQKRIKITFHVLAYRDTSIADIGNFAFIPCINLVKHAIISVLRIECEWIKKIRITNGLEENAGNEEASY